MTNVSRNPDDLHPALREVWFKLKALALSELGETITLTCTHRSKEEQARLYAIGRDAQGHKTGATVTNARPGQSAHNVAPPQGAHAFDFAVVNVNGSIDWDVKRYFPIAAIARRLGAESGAFWDAFVDAPHVQMPNWHPGKVYPQDYRFMKGAKQPPVVQPKQTLRLVNAGNNVVVGTVTIVGDKAYIEGEMLNPKNRGE